MMVFLMAPAVAHAADARQMSAGILTAAPAAVGLSAMAAGLAIPHRDAWRGGVGLAALGPIVGHLVGGRYTPSLVLLGVKTGGLALMVNATRETDFLDPERPGDANFWFGEALFSLGAGAEVYLGVDDALESVRWLVVPVYVPGGAAFSLEFPF